MWSLGVAGVERFIERLLPFVHCFERCRAPFDTEVLVEQRGVLDVLQLQEQFIRVLVWPTAELLAIVGQHHLDLGLVRLECGKHVIVHHMHCGDGQIAGVEPRPGEAGMAVGGGLQIDLPDAVERADEEGVYGDEGAFMRGLDVAFAELGREVFEEANLFFGEFDLAFSGWFSGPQQSLVLGQQTVAPPEAALAAGRDLEAFKAKLLLGLGGDAIGMQAFGPRQPLPQSIRALPPEPGTPAPKRPLRAAQKLPSLPLRQLPTFMPIQKRRKTHRSNPLRRLRTSHREALPGSSENRTDRALQKPDRSRGCYNL